MRATVLTIIALVGVIACDALIQGTYADGYPARQQRVRHVYAAPCRYGPCGPSVCPDLWSCRSMYGAYQPFGGPTYWSRYGLGYYGSPYIWR
jgi:hypothetical protein